MNADEAKRRSAYGRGVFDGMRLAGVENPGEFMNEQKLARLESGLNSMATKVLEAVPIQAAWGKEQIVGELRRTGCNAGKDVIEGCLDTLRGRGLIAEPTRGTFIRNQARPKTTHQEIKIVHSVSSPKPGATPAPVPPHGTGGDAFARIAATAASLRCLADDLEAVALDVEERLQAVEKDTEKLRQFQSLLKSLGQ